MLRYFYIIWESKNEIKISKRILVPSVKEVVRELFIEKCSWSYICVRNSISEKTLNKYRKKGIGEIIEMFDLGRMVR